MWWVGDTRGWICRFFFTEKVVKRNRNGDTTQKRKWLYVKSGEEIFKILKEIYAEQEGIKLESIVVEKKEKESENKWIIRKNTKEQKQN